MIRQHPYSWMRHQAASSRASARREATGIECSCPFRAPARRSFSSEVEAGFHAIRAGLHVGDRVPRGCAEHAGNANDVRQVVTVCRDSQARRGKPVGKSRIDRRVGLLLDPPVEGVADRAGVIQRAGQTQAVVADREGDGRCQREGELGRADHPVTAEVLDEGDIALVEHRPGVCVSDRIVVAALGIVDRRIREIGILGIENRYPGSQREHFIEAQGCVDVGAVDPGRGRILHDRQVGTRRARGRAGWHTDVVVDLDVLVIIVEQGKVQVQDAADAPLEADLVGIDFSGSAKGKVPSGFTEKDEDWKIPLLKPFE